MFLHIRNDQIADAAPEWPPTGGYVLPQKTVDYLAKNISLKLLTLVATNTSISFLYSLQQVTGRFTHTHTPTHKHTHTHIHTVASSQWAWIYVYNQSDYQCFFLRFSRYFAI